MLLYIADTLKRHDLSAQKNDWAPTMSTFAVIWMQKPRPCGQGEAWSNVIYLCCDPLLVDGAFMVMAPWSVRLDTCGCEAVRAQCIGATHRGADKLTLTTYCCEFCLDLDCYDCWIDSL